MKLLIGADHRGREPAERLTERLRQQGHAVECHIPGAGETSDYPDAAWAVAHAIAEKEADLAILLCGTGIGTSIAANKVHGVRAAVVHDEITAELSRAHNNANVICLSADLLGQRLIEKIVDRWLVTEFEGGRHDRRLRKIEMIERGDDPTQESR
ncbi:MAG: ribose 5-phosphate isomerase B [Phycisphaeraceae bacterium]|nr:MAG: ribose 5-phosphate isomerase B [Phycisphaeraceae bacterium]